MTKKKITVLRYEANPIRVKCDLAHDPPPCGMVHHIPGIPAYYINDEEVSEEDYREAFEKLKEEAAESQESQRRVAQVKADKSFMAGVYESLASYLRGERGIPWKKLRRK